MKAKTIIIGSVILASSAIAFGLMNNTPKFGQHQFACSVQTADIKQQNTIVNYRIPKVITSEEELVIRIDGAYNKSITKKVMLDANSIADFIPNYPSNWIKNYKSVILKVEEEQKQWSSVGSSDQLTIDQKEMLEKAPIGSVLEIEVKYLTENAATHVLEERSMNYQLVIKPHTEAAFGSVESDVFTYIKKNSFSFLMDEKYDVNQALQAEFYVAKDGKAHFLEFIKETENPRINAHIVSLINEMPKWQSAKDVSGKSVKQIFKLSIGGINC